MPEGKIITIRVNEQDLKSMELVREFLEDKYKDLPPKFREVTNTDIFKYTLSLWVRNYSNPDNKSKRTRSKIYGIIKRIFRR